MNVIFIEVEHALIPYTCQFIDKMASFKRIMSNTACATLNEVCKRTGSKIVCNSIHNYHLNDVNGNDLRTDLVLAGISPDHFHTDWRTSFLVEDKAYSKEQALADWLKMNSEVTECVILDAFQYRDFEHQSIVVDKCFGLDYRIYSKLMLIIKGVFV